MRKALILSGLAMVLFIGKSMAQAEGSDYSTAVGVKFWPGAISVKHFTSDNTALEGLLSFWGRGARLTGLYEIHNDLSGVEGLKWYYGAGAHFGWYGDGYKHGDHLYSSSSVSLGVDGILGLEYKFNQAPIALSLDIQPYFDIVSHAYIDLWGGLGIKYTF